LKVLVTGATGFVGGHLVETLVRHGYEIKALARPGSDTSLLKKLDVEIVEGDIRDSAAMKKAVMECQQVYHLAAKTTKSRLSKKDYRAYNVEGTINVAKAALDAGVNRLVYASSVGVYGTGCNSSIDENTAPNPDSYYRETKLAGEKEVLRLHRDGGLPVVVTRLGCVFGPGSLNWLDICRKIGKGSFRIIGAGENYDHMVYVEDLVDGLRRCGEVKGVEGRTYILAGPEPAKLGKVVEIIAEKLWADIPRDRLPLAPFRIYQRLCSLVFRSFGVQLPRSHYYDLFLMGQIKTKTKAQEELGYFPKVSLRDGFHRLLEWYCERGYLRPAEKAQRPRGGT
jgi:nucleoside-diphosphate-sugar epimerase